MIHHFIPTASYVVHAQYSCEEQGTLPPPWVEQNSEPAQENPEAPTLEPGGRGNEQSPFTYSVTVRSAQVPRILGVLRTRPLLSRI